MDDASPADTLRCDHAKPDSHGVGLFCCHANPLTRFQMTISPSLSEIQLNSVAFYGRTLSEYMRFFALAPEPLDGASILDVAAGPASFAAEAARRGLSVTAVDPLYGYPVDVLRAHVAIDYRHMQDQLRKRTGLLRCGAMFDSVEEAIAERRRGADRFLRDYESGFLHGRYVGGALPTLPFLDRQFDLVLCAHLLFVYARQFDFAFHLSACMELVRVSAGDVRIHPVCGLDGKPYPELDRLRVELEAQSIGSEIVPLDYAFFAGADSMLVLRRA